MRKIQTLDFIIQEDGFIPDFTQYRDERFFPDQYMGMYLIVLRNENCQSSPSFDFLKNLTSVFFFQLQRTPSLELKREKIEVQYDLLEIDELISSAPFMLGGEYLSRGWVLNLFSRYLKIFKTDIKKYKSTVDAYFSSYSTYFRLPSKIFFHLLESKKDETPFAFMATYSTINSEGKICHYPLKYALKEYKDSIDKLAVLISSIKKVAKNSTLIASWLSSGEIFAPLLLSKEEAFLFLCDTPKYEEAGIVTRVPIWWKKRKKSTKINIEVSNDNNTTSSILTLRPSMQYQGIEITKEEAEEIIAQGNGLLLFKGNWIEADSDNLKKLLNEYMLLDREDLSLQNALQYELGLEDKAFPIHIDMKAILNKAIENSLIIKPYQSFSGTLRSYQEDAFKWLIAVSKLGLGPLLADDMGLGKTVEMLSFLDSVRHYNEDAKILLIVPASLLGNWAHECEKFVPLISYEIRHGIGSKKADFPFLTIATYQGVAKSQAIKDNKWDIVVLDEAQNIKNRNTMQTKAIKSLDRKLGVAMTGTPIENSLSNLWSIFDFLSPGLLGSADAFSRYCDNLKQMGMENLKMVISPFILRRLKSDRTIINDLPDKIETEVMVTLTKEQRVLYNNVVDEYESELEKRKNAGEQVLTLAANTLMKLKMIVNHPSQYLGDNEFEEKKSGKFLLLRELCETIHENRERVLIFTQFATIIPTLMNFLNEIFNQEGQSIDGSTPVKKRTEIVDSFQNGEYPFLVISLKAGGTGLTLTRATNVIHFDRWWNPAVEDQATDRAYRIGQKNRVSVYKFVAQDTIEEKISEILKQKSELATSILSDAGGEITTKLSPEELLKAMKCTREIK
ncbi:MAG: DEAD/DEAH box helicase [Spirochaetales bacterium]|nr:DEAD/DEAH box helicase [Spirochaetales bacterium]